MDSQATDKKRPRQRVINPVPGEGENGLFSQTWWPICLSSDLRSGRVIGRDFLDGRVIVMRGADGVAQVMSAYCPHVGADLSVGKVIGNHVQCAFHNWEFDRSGTCARTGVGDPPPPNACLFVFPTEEKHGIIWAFNGEEPLFAIPDFAFPTSRLLIKSFVFPNPIKCDGWVFACNTPDIQHIRSIHGCQFESTEPVEQEWTPYSMKYRALGTHQRGEPLDLRAEIRGSNIFVQDSYIDNKWLGVIAPFSCPRPGVHELFFVCAVLKDDSTEEKSEASRRWLEEATLMEIDFGSQDLDILNTIHYRPGHLTRSDGMLAKFLDHLRRYPRTHPSAAFIN